MLQKVLNPEHFATRVSHLDGKMSDVAVVLDPPSADNAVDEPKKKTQRRTRGKRSATTKAPTRAVKVARRERAPRWQNAQNQRTRAASTHAIELAACSVGSLPSGENSSGLEGNYAQPCVAFEISHSLGQEGKQTGEFTAGANARPPPRGNPLTRAQSQTNSTQKLDERIQATFLFAAVDVKQEPASPASYSDVWYSTSDFVDEYNAARSNITTLSNESNSTTSCTGLQEGALGMCSVDQPNFPGRSGSANQPEQRKHGRKRCLENVIASIKMKTSKVEDNFGISSPSQVELDSSLITGINVSDSSRVETDDNSDMEGMPQIVCVQSLTDVDASGAVHIEDCLDSICYSSTYDSCAAQYQPKLTSTSRDHVSHSNVNQNVSQITKGKETRKLEQTPSYTPGSSKMIKIAPKPDLSTAQTNNLPHQILPKLYEPLNQVQENGSSINSKVCADTFALVQPSMTEIASSDVYCSKSGSSNAVSDTNTMARFILTPQAGQGQPGTVIVASPTTRQNANAYIVLDSTTVPRFLRKSADGTSKDIMEGQESPNTSAPINARLILPGLSSAAKFIKSASVGTVTEPTLCPAVGAQSNSLSTDPLLSNSGSQPVIFTPCTSATSVTRSPGRREYTTATTFTTCSFNATSTETDSIAGTASARSSELETQTSKASALESQTRRKAKRSLKIPKRQQSHPRTSVNSMPLRSVPLCSNESGLATETMVNCDDKDKQTNREVTVHGSDAAGNSIENNQNTSQQCAYKCEFRNCKRIFYRRSDLDQHFAWFPDHAIRVFKFHEYNTASSDCSSFLPAGMKPYYRKARVRELFKRLTDAELKEFALPRLVKNNLGLSLWNFLEKKAEHSRVPGSLMAKIFVEFEQFRVEVEQKLKNSLDSQESTSNIARVVNPLKMSLSSSAPILVAASLPSAPVAMPTTVTSLPRAVPKPLANGFVEQVSSPSDEAIPRQTASTSTHSLIAVADTSPSAVLLSTGQPVMSSFAARNQRRVARRNKTLTGKDKPSLPCSQTSPNVVPITAGRPNQSCRIGKPNTMLPVIYPRILPKPPQDWDEKLYLEAPSMPLPFEVVNGKLLKKFIKKPKANVNEEEFLDFVKNKPYRAAKLLHDAENLSKKKFLPTHVFPDFFEAHIEALIDMAVSMLVELNISHLKYRVVLRKKVGRKLEAVLGYNIFPSLSKVKPVSRKMHQELKRIHKKNQAKKSAQPSGKKKAAAKKPAKRQKIGSSESSTEEEEIKLAYLTEEDEEEAGEEAAGKSSEDSLDSQGEDFESPAEDNSVTGQSAVAPTTRRVTRLLSRASKTNSQDGSSSSATCSAKGPNGVSEPLEKTSPVYSTLGGSSAAPVHRPVPDLSGQPLTESQVASMLQTTPGPALSPAEAQPPTQIVLDFTKHSSAAISEEQLPGIATEKQSPSSLHEESGASTTPKAGMRRLSSSDSQVELVEGFPSGQVRDGVSESHRIADVSSAHITKTFAQASTQAVLNMSGVPVTKVPVQTTVQATQTGSMIPPISHRPRSTKVQASVATQVVSARRVPLQGIPQATQTDVMNARLHAHAPSKSNAVKNTMQLKTSRTKRGLKTVSHAAAQAATYTGVHIATVKGGLPKAKKRVHAGLQAVTGGKEITDEERKRKVHRSQFHKPTADATTQARITSPETAATEESSPRSSTHSVSPSYRLGYLTAREHSRNSSIVAANLMTHATPIFSQNLEFQDDSLARPTMCRVSSSNAVAADVTTPENQYLSGGLENHNKGRSVARDCGFSSGEPAEYVTTQRDISYPDKHIYESISQPASEAHRLVNLKAIGQVAIDSSTRTKPLPEPESQTMCPVSEDFAECIEAPQSPQFVSTQSSIASVSQKNDIQAESGNSGLFCWSTATRTPIIEDPNTEGQESPADGLCTSRSAGHLPTCSTELHVTVDATETLMGMALEKNPSQQALVHGKCREHMQNIHAGSFFKKPLAVGQRHSQFDAKNASVFHDFLSTTNVLQTPPTISVQTSTPVTLVQFSCRASQATQVQVSRAALADASSQATLFEESSATPVKPPQATSLHTHQGIPIQTSPKASLVQASTSQCTVSETLHQSALEQILSHSKAVQTLPLTTPALQTSLQVTPVQMSSNPKLAQVSSHAATVPTSPKATPIQTSFAPPVIQTSPATTVNTSPPSQVTPIETSSPAAALQSPPQATPIHTTSYGPPWISPRATPIQSQCHATLVHISPQALQSHVVPVKTSPKATPIQTSSPAALVRTSPLASMVQTSRDPPVEALLQTTMIQSSSQTRPGETSQSTTVQMSQPKPIQPLPLATLVLTALQSKLVQKSSQATPGQTSQPAFVTFVQSPLQATTSQATSVKRSQSSLVKKSFQVTPVQTLSQPAPLSTTYKTTLVQALKATETLMKMALKQDPDHIQSKHQVRLQDVNASSIIYGPPLSTDQKQISVNSAAFLQDPSPIQTPQSTTPSSQDFAVQSYQVTPLLESPHTMLSQASYQTMPWQSSNVTQIQESQVMPFQASCVTQIQPASQNSTVQTSQATPVVTSSKAMLVEVSHVTPVQTSAQVPLVRSTQASLLQAPVGATLVQTYQSTPVQMSAEVPPVKSSQDLLVLTPREATLVERSQPTPLKVSQTTLINTSSNAIPRQTLKASDMLVNMALKQDPTLIHSKQQGSLQDDHAAGFQQRFTPIDDESQFAGIDAASLQKSLLTRPPRNVAQASATESPKATPIQTSPENIVVQIQSHTTPVQGLLLATPIQTSQTSSALPSGLLPVPPSRAFSVVTSTKTIPTKTTQTISAPPSQALPVVTSSKIIPTQTTQTTSAPPSQALSAVTSSKTIPTQTTQTTSARPSQALSGVTSSKNIPTQTNQTTSAPPSQALSAVTSSKAKPTRTSQNTPVTPLEVLQVVSSSKAMSLQTSMSVQTSLQISKTTPVPPSQDLSVHTSSKATLLQTALQSMAVQTPQATLANTSSQAIPIPAPSQANMHQISEDTLVQTSSCATPQKTPYQIIPAHISIPTSLHQTPSQAVLPSILSLTTLVQTPTQVTLSQTPSQTLLTKSSSLCALLKEPSEATTSEATPLQMSNHAPLAELPVLTPTSSQNTPVETPSQTLLSSTSSQNTLVQTSSQILPTDSLSQYTMKETQADAAPCHTSSSTVLTEGLSQSTLVLTSKAMSLRTPSVTMLSAASSQTTLPQIPSMATPLQLPPLTLLTPLSSQAPSQAKLPQATSVPVLTSTSSQTTVVQTPSEVKLPQASSVAVLTSTPSQTTLIRVSSQATPSFAPKSRASLTQTTPSCSLTVTEKRARLPVLQNTKTENKSQVSQSFSADKLSVLGTCKTYCIRQPPVTALSTPSNPDVTPTASDHVNETNKEQPETESFFQGHSAVLTLTTPEGGHLLSKEASAQLTPPLGLPVEDIYPGITSGTSCTNVVALSVAHKAALPLPTAVMPLSVAQETVEEVPGASSSEIKVAEIETQEKLLHSSSKEEVSQTSSSGRGIAALKRFLANKRGEVNPTPKYTESASCSRIHAEDKPHNKGLVIDALKEFLTSKLRDGQSEGEEDAAVDCPRHESGDGPTKTRAVEALRTFLANAALERGEKHLQEEEVESTEQVDTRTPVLEALDELLASRFSEEKEQLEVIEPLKSSERKCEDTLKTHVVDVLKEFLASRSSARKDREENADVGTCGDSAVYKAQVIETLKEFLANKSGCTLDRQACEVETQQNRSDDRDLQKEQWTKALAEHSYCKVAGTSDKRKRPTKTRSVSSVSRGTRVSQRTPRISFVSDDAVPSISVHEPASSPTKLSSSQP